MRIKGIRAKEDALSDEEIDHQRKRAETSGINSWSMLDPVSDRVSNVCSACILADGVGIRHPKKGGVF